MKRTTKISGLYIPGPLIAATYLLLVCILIEIVLFEVWWFILPYLLALVMTLVFQIKKFEFNPNRSYLQLIPLTFLGAMLDHSMMALGSVYLLEIPPPVFRFGIFPAMLVERTIATFLGALLGFVILKVFGEEISNETNQEI